MGSGCVGSASDKGRAEEEIWMRGREPMREIEEAKIAGRKGILYKSG